MKLRPVQLVCLALLLSTLSLADSSAVVPGQYGMQGNYLRALLLTDYASTLQDRKRQEPVSASHSLYLAATSDRVTLALSSASAAANETAWTMRPPSAQQAALQTFTSFGRVSA